MPKFTYRVTHPDGTSERGRLEAVSERAARAELLERGLDVGELRERRSLAELEITKRRVKPAELMHASRQLGAFVGAGIPIVEGLNSIAEGSENPRLAEVVQQMVQSLSTGATFAEAVHEHPDVFPEVYRGMVTTAELTGNLDAVLHQLADYLERDIDARHQVRSAMAYPAVVLGTSLMTVIVLAAYVMPKFEAFFADLGATLPLTTRMLLGTTAALQRWWLVIAGGMLGAVLAFLAWARTGRGRATIDGALLRVPVLGETVRYVIVERFCRTLGSMVTAGVPLPDALAVAGAGTNNQTFRRALDGVRDQMVRGDGLARPIADTALFPIAVTQMVRAGEKTGSLDDQLVNAADYFERELRFRIKNLTSLLEPLVIIVVAGIVGFVALALVSAMYGIFRQSQVFG
jgi:type IV pilus assembly protein PilC